MSTTSQRKASSVHRRRAAARGLVRVEVQAAKRDVALIRDVAEALRSDPERAETLRASVQGMLGLILSESALDVFGTDLSDDVFDGVFTPPRDRAWREIDL